MLGPYRRIWPDADSDCLILQAEGKPGYYVISSFWEDDDRSSNRFALWHFDDLECAETFAANGDIYEVQKHLWRKARTNA